MSLNNENNLLTKEKTRLKKPDMYAVIMLNDDYTPMEFVIYVLQSVFKKNYEDAKRIMLLIHNEGKGICGVFPLDIAETKAIKEVFGKHAYALNISSTKTMTGHLLGAAGAIEAIACVKAIEKNIIPPTINFESEDENIDYNLNLTLNKAQKRDAKIGMSNTFGFGGHNACVLFKKWD